MQPKVEGSKLAELRAKTDKQLVALINHRLDVGIRWARRIAALDPAQDHVAIKQIRDFSGKAYDDALLLLPTVSDLEHASLARLRQRLAELRDLIDDIPAEQGVPAQAAYS